MSFDYKDAREEEPDDHVWVWTKEHGWVSANAWGGGEWMTQDTQAMMSFPIEKYPYYIEKPPKPPAYSEEMEGLSPPTITH